MPKFVKTDLDFEGIARLKNLPDAIDPQDAVTFAQLSSAVEGLSWKDSARVASLSNLNLAASGATIDGVTMVVNDRFVALAQSLPAQCGIYIWNGAAVPATRALDASTFAELEQAVISVEEGTNANTTWRQTQVNGTIGVDPVVFTSFASAVPIASESTAGISELATQGETDTGTDDQRVITPLKLANYAGRAKRSVHTFGDNAATQYTLTHNLNTRAVIVQVRQNSGTYSEVICDVEATTVNSVTVKFASAVPLNSLTATIVA